jgi:predicted membrane metal-binding protein
MSGPNQLHEDFGREAEVAGSSDRSFGLVFAAVFAVIALWRLMGGGAARFWPLGIAAAFALVAMARPGLLAPLNRLWTRLGRLLHRVVSPLVMGMLFYLTVTPVGIVMRALGKDPLRLRPDPGAASYWIERDPPGPSPESMKNQF